MNPLVLTGLRAWCLVAGFIAALAMAWPGTGQAADFNVPSMDYPTIQEAVDAAAAGGAAENFIHLQAERFDLHGEITIDAGFDAGHTLVIRPDPGIGALRRVTLANDNGFQPIIRIQSVGAVTLQDLDLIRHTTNHRNLLEIWHGDNVIVERCRVGSDWPVAGDEGYANIYIEDAQPVIVRNTFCFAYAAGTLDAGIRVDTPTAMNNLVYLYNNTVADHRLYGLDIKSRGDSALVLRNNVVVNRVGLEPEPFAYRADVEPLVQVFSRYNTAFASPANVELIVLNPGESIIGAEGFLLLPRATAADAFLETHWIVEPLWHPNPHFHRLRLGGPLHNLETDAGVNVRNQEPEGIDLPVTDDWEKDPRPSGDPERTDRGADQVTLPAIADLEVLWPRIPVFTGASIGVLDDEEMEIIAVGPQEDIPIFQEGEAMRGGEFSVSGAFVSIATPRLVSLSPAPTVPRSTYYDGTPGAMVEFPAAISFDPAPAMTIEAWVFREDTNRVETIVSHDRGRSFWFGFNGPRLHFQRGPGAGADSESPVAARRWTHVAVVYDGSVRFYIDGEAAGSATLGAAPVPELLPLWIGGDPMGLNFFGYLDEVRLWAVARSPADIRGLMFDELPRAPGLVIALPSGAAADSVLGLVGQVGAGVSDQLFGVVPRALQVPRALFPVVMDGAVHTESEYVGAAQVPIRYDADDHVPDAIAYLVYRDEPGDRNLYVGIKDLRDVPDDRERSNCWVTVTVDADRSMNPLADFFDFQIRAFLSADPAQLWVGDGTGGYRHLFADPGPDGDFHVAYDWPIELGRPPTIEIRIARDLLGQWSETDGMLFGQFDVEAAGDNYLAPNGTVWNSPATWPAVTYVENRLSLPVASIQGHVYGLDQDQPVANQSVRLAIDRTGERLDTDTTDAQGAFSFESGVPYGESLRVEVGDCSQCLYLRSVVLPTGIQAKTNLPSLVVFPAAHLGTNVYSEVDFYLLQSLGPVELTRYDPSNGAPALRLRDEPLKTLPGDTIRISGRNLHPNIQVFLYDCLDLPPNPLLGCELGVDYFEAEIVNRDDHNRWVQVVVPSVPATRWVGWWSWVVKDNWVRQGQVEWTRIGGAAGDHFSLRRPLYPLVDGFEFRNGPLHGAPDLEDFDAVFGWSGWVWAPVPGCWWVRNPFSLLYEPIFAAWMAGGGAQCNGMSGTSLLLSRLALDPESDALNSDANVHGIHYAAGFSNQVHATYRDLHCTPYRPVNLRAHIRANHGVQTSYEYIQAVLDQMVGGWFSLEGQPSLVLDRVRGNPRGYVISMVPEVGTGHVVTPYAVEDGVNPDGEPDPDSSLIWIYDSNYPEDTTRYIWIQPNMRDGQGTYYFPHDDENTWTGQGIYAVPIHIFTDERTVPGLLTAAEAAILLVFGDADALYTGTPGNEWGWRQDGTPVDHMYGVKAIVPSGNGFTTNRNAMLVLPMTNPPPAVQVNVRGSHYYFHAAQGGHVLQLERHDGHAGDRDAVSIAYENDRLSSVRYAPQSPASRWNARIGMELGIGQSAVFDWSGLVLDPGQAAEFVALSASRGAELRNDSGVAARPTMTLSWVDGPAAAYGTNEFGPFDVPAGASLRALVHDWPTASTIRCETDLDRDGTPDRVEMVNRNEPPPLRVQATVEGGQLVLSWPRTTVAVSVESTPSLVPPVSWTPLTVQPEVRDQTMRATLPITGPTRFFRLRY